MKHLFCTLFYISAAKNKKGTIKFRSYAMALFMLLAVQGFELKAQEKFGKTLNLGLGLGYYSYAGYYFPAVHLNYELDVARNFTLAPFLTYYTYHNYVYWGNMPAYPYKNYYYNEMVIPLGVKGSYYFDELFNAGPKWDFYAAASLGFRVRKVVWENGYNGDVRVERDTSPLYTDIHIGTEYHLSKRIGLYFDFSSGMSSIGIAVHSPGTGTTK